jgi:hypothetical protein
MRFLGLAALGLVAPVSGAQEINGRVLMGDGTTPAAAVVVIASSVSGATAGKSLSTTSGRYHIPLSAGGTYDLRALRIGYRPTLVRVTVGNDAIVTQDIILNSQPVSIAGMKITDESDCSLTGKNSATFLVLLEQARAALASASLWEQSGSLRAEIVRLEGHIDATYGNRNDSLYAEIDTAGARRFIATRALGATPPETLNTAGYLRPAGSGRYLYDLPNAEVLLSEGFVSGHCFSIRSNRDDSALIGLGFHPRKRVGDFVDVRGTLWLERESAELRRLEFEYDNTPVGPFEVCDKAPFIRITPDLLNQVPPFRQPEPTCRLARNTRDNVLELGGSAEFVRLSTGEWLISRTMLRTGPDEARYRRMWRKSRYLPREKRSERCAQGPDCHELITLKSRLVTVETRTVRVIRDGVEIFRDSSADNLMEAIVRKRGKP